MNKPLMLVWVLLAGCQGRVGGLGPTGGGGGGGEPVAVSPFVDAGVTTPITVESGLPKLPELEAVVAVSNDDSATISFHPVDGAADYRVYELPADARIQVSGQDVIVENALYRCAGLRQSIPTVIDDGVDINTWFRTLVEAEVQGFRRTLPDAQLGYVYVSPGDGRLPVYALGDPSAFADNLCGPGRWGASRVKLYTTSETERAQLLAQKWRDDGIAFYVPADGDLVLQTLQTDPGAKYDARLYFSAGTAEARQRTGAKTAFKILSAPAAGAHALMRVNYATGCGNAHDELVVGKTLFERARRQGADQPRTDLLWTGLTGPTTLVIEALATGCPYQGRLGPMHLDERTDGHPAGPYTHDATFTLAELTRQAPHGEVFVNGQYDGVGPPRAIARSFVRVEPVPHPVMDWFADFKPGTTLAPFTTRQCRVPDGNCYQMFEASSDQFDLLWHTVETGSYGLTTMLGELWVQYSDHAADTNGKFRLVPTQRARVQPSSYLHVTMEVDAVSTLRRYPQIIVSDLPSPVQYSLAQGKSVLLQPIYGTPELQLQLCDHRYWDVNNQCPYFDFYRRFADTGEVLGLSPVQEVLEHTAPDRRTRFDLFLSPTRAYVFMDQKPHGCVDLPEVSIPTGDVTVVFGDVLYHSEVDGALGFNGRHFQMETQRHFDNLGFSSGVPAPPWDENRFPCVPANALREFR